VRFACVGRVLCVVWMGGAGLWRGITAALGHTMYLI